jgi:membrane protein
MTDIPTLLYRSIRDFFKDDGLFLSASLSYYVMLTIVPLGLFVVALIGSLLGGNPGLRDFFVDKLVGLFPQVTGTITGELKKLISYTEIGRWSILLYALLSLQLYSAMHYAMETVFNVQEKRSCVSFILHAIILVTLLMCLIFISFALTTLVPLLTALKPLLPWLRIGLITSIVVQYVVPLGLIQFAAIVVYMMLPKRKILFRHAFWGGLFTAVFLEVAKYAFTWYVGTIMRLGTIYGSLSVFVVFLLWVYYAASIFLVGGEIVHNLTEKTGSREKSPRVMELP